MRRIIQLLIGFAIFSLSSLALASEYRGQVIFGGLPMPGATVTVIRGDKKLSAVSDQDGVYSFADLADGEWTIKIAMQCFAPIKAKVTISSSTPAGKWELTLLPLDQIAAHVQPAKPETGAPPAPSVAAANKLEAAEASKAGVVEIPKPPEETNEQSADGFLINGSVNNAATSPFSTSPAFGNTRTGSKGLYNGGFAVIVGNSALDARPYSISGFEVPKDSYNHITSAFTIGGPLNIPHLLPHGPEFFVSYQWTRNNNAAINTGLVPTALERSGDFSGLLNALGQPVTIYNPATGLSYSGNVVPASSQAQALLRLYPLPNITRASSYNYQAPVLNSSHLDSLQTRMNKWLGRAYKDQLYGGFNFQSTRSSSVNLFDFMDRTDALGMNANINWMHRFGSRLFFIAGYTFSRQRTLVRPNFKERVNVSGAAGISGNDQDAANWGPPALNFSSGIAALTDANSSFNRNRTDGMTASVQSYRGRHNITAGGEFRKQDVNDFFQQNPRGTFTFTGAATQNVVNGTMTGGSDLADFLIGVPDTSSIAFGNADKYFRQPVYTAYINDDWRILPVLTVNAGLRWDYEAPITELHGRLVNLDSKTGFTAALPVLGSDPIGPLTGDRYPASLIRPDRRGFEPRIGISWRPIPASTVVVRAGYGIYHDTSVYQSLVLQLAQQAPLSKSLSVANSADCPLTLANGFISCSLVAANTFAIDPNFRVGYAQTWQLAVQRDLPLALQLTATYLGVKGTHGAQEVLPNSYPIGAANPCSGCSSGFVYQTSGGNSTREAGQLQLRRRLRSGFAASLLYTYSKSIDDDAYLGGTGHGAAGGSGQTVAAPATIAQNWLDPRAERSLSTFDQRHLLNVQAQYTSGEGLHGGTLMNVWRGRILKEWTVFATITRGTGLPETPIYPAAVPGTGFTGSIRPDLTGSPVYNSGTRPHLNVAAYAAPSSGQWGTAGRTSITGPGQFSLDASLARTFRPHGRFFLDFRVDSANLFNHGVFSSWNTTVSSTQFGLPVAANPMRSLQTTVRLRF